MQTSSGRSTARRRETAAEDLTHLPLIAICGRPNVGKSTLFNRLTGSRRSIVGDEPGITRDRIYGVIDWLNQPARIVDTGGIVPDDPELIPGQIFRQAQTALIEADAIVMVVDGRTHLASPDLDLARLLLRTGKPSFLAVNKIDTAGLVAGAEDFRSLGFKNTVAISAEHGNGIGDLLDAVFETLPKPTEPNVAPEAFLTAEDEMAEDEDGPDFTPPPGTGTGLTEHTGEDPAEELSFPGEAEEPASSADTEQPRRLRSHGDYTETETRIAIIGRPNVGKSTLLNALTGTERAIVSPIAGTTRDAVDEVVTRDHHDFRFVDTAGIRRKGKTKLMAEKLSVIMARKHLEAADIALLVLDATEGVHALDANIGGYAHESGRSVIIVVNKWDLLTNPPKPAGAEHPEASGAPSKGGSGHGRESRKSATPEMTFRSERAGSEPAPRPDQKTYEQAVRDKLKYLDYAPLVFLSAAKGKGIDALYKKIELVARERRKRVTTGQMNRFLARVDFQKAGVPSNRRIRIYYMTQAAVAPPTFVLFTDRDTPLHFSYERFLANQIRDTFRFIGTPIWFKTRPRNKKKEE
ncbi:MAG: ribosome biogenesis GTPase Der [Acidobacteriota bacterium]|nr:ribosome biogenesis GTPase Der [Acidobacteriota bacterium]